MILILTNEDDVTTDFVVQELKRGEFVRVNTERLATTGSISYTFDSGQIDGEIRFGDERLLLSNVTAVYCRRAATPDPSPSVVEQGLRSYVRTEFRALIDGLSRLVEGRWINHPLAVHRAESKVFQLATAQRNGFIVPRTIITSDGQQARAFAQRQDGPLIAKALAAPRVQLGGAEQIMFTSRLPEDGDPFVGLELAPCIIQEQVQKRVDIRVTVVGEKAFAVEIDSQSTPEAVVDWRAADALSLPHRVHQLPKDVEETCIRICDEMHLTFGAIDLAIDQNGRYVFFEVNPNGQWAWVQILTGLPIAKAIAQLLRDP
jgi:hypothetical protein